MLYHKKQQKNYCLPRVSLAYILVEWGMGKSQALRGCSSGNPGPSRKLPLEIHKMGGIFRALLPPSMPASALTFLFIPFATLGPYQIRLTSFVMKANNCSPNTPISFCLNKDFKREGKVKKEGVFGYQFWST